MKRTILALALAAATAGPILASANIAAAAPGRRGPPPRVAASRPAPPRAAPSWDRNRYNGYYSGNQFHYGPPPVTYYSRPDYRPAYTPWARGQVLPSYYRGTYVTDWRARGLRAPPSGYRWYYSNGDYILAAITTGLIFDLIAGSH